ncbi:MAG: acyl carrier protein [Ruminococcus sp.]|jgi:acyl carrier protein|nr:acyl carrier protein [Ruminococcus sp.]
MLEEIKELVAESLGASIEELTEETSFTEDLDADSLDLFEMVMELEDKYDVKIPSEDLENIKTIGDVKQYIEEHK